MLVPRAGITSLVRGEETVLNFGTNASDRRDDGAGASLLPRAASASLLRDAGGASLRREEGGSSPSPTPDSSVVRGAGAAETRTSFPWKFDVVLGRRMLVTEALPSTPVAEPRELLVDVENMRP